MWEKRNDRRIEKKSIIGKKAELRWLTVSARRRCRSPAACLLWAQAAAHRTGSHALASEAPTRAAIFLHASQRLGHGQCLTSLSPGKFQRPDHGSLVSAVSPGEHSVGNWLNEHRISLLPPCIPEGLSLCWWKFCLRLSIRQCTDFESQSGGQTTPSITPPFGKRINWGPEPGNTQLGRSRAGIKTNPSGFCETQCHRSKKNHRFENQMQRGSSPSLL